MWRKKVSERKIGKQMMLPKSTVRNILTSFQENGHLEPVKPKGRSCVVTEREKNLLRRLAVANRRLSMDNISSLWNDTIGKTYCKKTCARILKTMGYKQYAAKKKPALSKIQMRKRLQWAKQFSLWTEDDWKRVVWSDEARFELQFGSQTSTVIRRPNEAYLPECIKKQVKFPTSVMVWGCMSGNGLSKLCFVDGTVNTEKYESILEEYLIPFIDEHHADGNFVFQQDGATCHTSKKSMAWFERNNIEVLPWTANSPDLSPIENIWGEMKKHLRKRQPKTKEELMAELSKIWATMSLRTVHNFIEKEQRRIRAVITNNGGVTKY